MTDNPFTDRLRKLADDLGCRPLANAVLDNPRFSLWAGASKPHQHHYGRGKLAEHVCEVVELALQSNDYFEKVGKGVDRVKLYLAALFHDVGKLWDYEPVDMTYQEWRGNDHRHKIHHITRSSLLWYEASREQNWKPADVDEVLHCILSHHGMKEWGSPVAPQTRMAWLLHLADGMSARIDDCDKRLPFSTEPISSVK